MVQAARRQLARLGPWAAHPVPRNAAAMYVSLAVGTLVTLVLVADLSRVLGPTHWGELLLAQALSTWLGIVVAYGFGLGGARAVAQARSDRQALGRLAAGILGAQGLLLLASLPLAVLAAVLLPPFRHHAAFVPAAWCLSVAANLTPGWYFQGVERMVPLAMAPLVSGVLSAVLTLALVRHPDQALTALWLQTGGVAASTAWLLRRMCRELAVPWPTRADVRRGLRTGSSMFLFRLSVLFYTNANTLILGLFVPPALVSFYGAAERINKQALGWSGPIGSALFPRISHLVRHDPQAARRLARLYLLAMTAFGLLAGGLIALLAPWLVRLLLGARYGAAVPLVRLLAALVPAIAVSGVLGTRWMVPLGMDRDFNRIIAAAGALNVLSAVLLVPRLGDAGMALAVVGSEFFVTAAMLWVLGRRGAGLLRPLPSPAPQATAPLPPEA